MSLPSPAWVSRTLNQRTDAWAEIRTDSCMAWRFGGCYVAIDTDPPLPPTSLQTSLLALQEVDGEEDLITDPEWCVRVQKMSTQRQVTLCPTRQVPAQQQRARSPRSESLFARTAGPPDGDADHPQHGLWGSWPSAARLAPLRGQPHLQGPQRWGAELETPERGSKVGASRVLPTAEPALLSQETLSATPPRCRPAR